MSHALNIICAVMAVLFPIGLYAMKRLPKQFQFTHRLYEIAAPLTLHLALFMLTVRSLK